MVNNRPLLGSMPASEEDRDLPASSDEEQAACTSSMAECAKGIGGCSPGGVPTITFAAALGTQTGSQVLTSVSEQCLE